MPVLTPVGRSSTLPRVLNKSLNFAVELSGPHAFGAFRRAVVRPPRSLPGDSANAEEIAGWIRLLFLSSILHHHVANVTGMTCRLFTSSASRAIPLFVDDEETKNLREP